MKPPSRLPLPAKILSILLTAALPACATAPTQQTAPTLQNAELAYQQLRFFSDQIELAKARNGQPNGELSMSQLQARFDESLGETRKALSEIAPEALNAEDLHAYREMEKTVENLATAPPEAADNQAEGFEAACRFDLEEALADASPLQSLKSRLYRCFGSAAENLSVNGEPTDRLTVLGRLTATEDASQRKELFEALSPLWTGVNRGNEKDSPYRTLIRLSADELRRKNVTLESQAASTLGINPQSIEDWLVQMLQTWRDANPGQSIEPWDYWRQAGGAAAALDDRAALDSLRDVNDRFYRDLGADPEELGIVYDLAPRPGKTPVAFANFARRNRLENGRWVQGEFWVFATYREGGLGNLAELLHETGHGVHIAAIRTRPAFHDWPDNITFTEGLADLAGWDVYEPEWQRRYLGASAPLGDSLRAKYAWVILDAAWSLFELRMHRDPERDPNQLWTEITEQYLGIRPYPQHSWWALRGQLVELPGYMLNYAIGAVVVAQTRARVGEKLDSSFGATDDWYRLVSEGLFRYGLERPSAQVLRDFLGEEVSPEALMRDMQRMQ